MKRETALRRRSSIIRLQKVSIFFPINFDQLIPSYPAKNWIVKGTRKRRSRRRRRSHSHRSVFFFD